MQSRLLCHALQGIEATALRAVITKYPKKIMLPMHDGWVSKERLDLAELESTITQATGIALTVEETVLPKYAPDTQPEPSKWYTTKLALPTGSRSLVISSSPQWSLPPTIRGIVTRTDIARKRALLAEQLETG